MATACSKPAGGSCPLDIGIAGRRDGQADRAREPVARDGAPALGRERTEALAQRHVVHPAGRRRPMSPAWRTCSTSMPKLPIRQRPVVCFDESPTQLIGEVRQPIPAEPGQRERYDCEYKRNGTVNLFVFVDAHRPWRTVKVTEHRTARRLRPLHARTRRSALSRRGSYPGRDGQPFDPHARCALRDFLAAEAHRLLRRLEIHYTPKHASWLNMVEIEYRARRSQFE